jgi:hypothetical protein
MYDYWRPNEINSFSQNPHNIRVENSAIKLARIIFDKDAIFFNVTYLQWKVFKT